MLVVVSIFSFVKLSASTASDAAAWYFENEFFRFLESVAFKKNAIKQSCEQFHGACKKAFLGIFPFYFFTIWTFLKQFQVKMNVDYFK